LPLLLAQSHSPTFAAQSANRRRNAVSSAFPELPQIRAARLHISPDMLHAANFAAGDSLFPIRFELATVAPGPNSGGTPFRQLRPAYPLADPMRPIKALQKPEGERQRRNISARKVSELTCIRKRISLKLNHQSALHTARLAALQQAWMNSRNQTTIATLSKSRQLLFEMFSATCLWRFSFSGSRRD
jgi:hypothetical protein